MLEKIKQKIKIRIQAGIQNEWVRNTLWMMLSHGLKIVLQATYFIIVARALKPEQYGAFIAATAFVEIVAPFATLGAGDLLVKNVARDRQLFSVYWGNALFLMVVSGVGLMAGLFVVAPLALPKTVSPLLLFFAALNSLFSGRSLDLAGKAYQSVYQLKRTAQLNLLPHILRVTAAIALAMFIPSPNAETWMMLSVGCISLAAVIALYGVQKELGRPRLAFDTMIPNLKEGSYFAVGLSAQTVYNDIDKTMLAKLDSLDAAGMYAAAYRLIDVAFVPVRSLLAASYTKFFQAGKSGIQGSLQVAQKLLPLMVGYGGVMGLILVLGAPIVPLILGDEYANSTIALQWLAPLILFKSLHYIAADTLSGADLQGNRSLIQVMIAIFNVGLNLYLIPKYQWYGAVWSSLASDGLLLILLSSLVGWQLHRAKQNRSDQTSLSPSDGVLPLQVIAAPAFKTRHENPYNWLLYHAMGELGVQVDEFSSGRLLRQLLRPTYHIWHLHWPELPLNHRNPVKAIAKLGIFSGLLAIAKLRHIKLVWTVHNLKAHEGYYPRLEAGFWHLFTQQLDGFISLSQAGLEVAQQRFPNLRRKPGFIIPHSHYRGEYDQDCDRQLARQQLGIAQNAKVLLFFGRIRDYKNVSHLIETFYPLQDEQAILYIAGRPESATQAVLEQMAQRDRRVQLQLNFIPQAETQFYFQAADLVVLPYREILNSGTALLALSFDRPVLVPERGSMGELQTSVGSDWVRTYGNDLTAAELEKALTWAIQTPRAQKAPLEPFDGQVLAEKTIAAYRAIAQI
jgi:O-antigen/teichoic acid export membrane protein